MTPPIVPRGSNAALAAPPKNAFNRIPQWLRQDKGLPDWLAGTVVVIVTGLGLAALISLLVLVFPVR
jgi:hypothetical protein